MKTVMSLLMGLLLWGSSARAENLTPILLANGNNHFTCDDSYTGGYWRLVIPVNKTVVALYLFIATSAPAIDATIASPKSGLSNALIDIHQVDQSYADIGYSVERYRTYAPDGVSVDDLYIGAACGLTHWFLVYAMVYVK